MIRNEIAIASGARERRADTDSTNLVGVGCHAKRLQEYFDRAAAGQARPPGCFVSNPEFNEFGTVRCNHVRCLHNDVYLDATSGNGTLEQDRR